ncbi:tyrosine--tRNA ligase [Candidatus Dependentiae bacterium]|nr:tyrosine--tRNA ligase [Candidatus Dependentiae bacterium]MCC7414772.1 tyrosine--tRNA ligase [Campylobacterota bacterium]
MESNKALELISTGIVQAIPVDELQKKLSSGKKLIIKLGMDPTAPDLHLGHAVVLSKLKQFQDLGHQIMFLIGDFTARIGDPTGRSKTRPPLTIEEINNNTQTYFKQVSKILDQSRVTIVYNSTWLGALSTADLLQLCAKVTLARLTEREDFSKRIEQNQPIGFHELLYPLFQGYDSVALQADVELGGTDQTFNLLMGRFLQEHYGQSPQVVITTPLLEGLDGHEKMSKSLGNTISLIESAEQAYGKLMSISDMLMWRYLEVLLHIPAAAITELQEQVAEGKQHPMQLKKRMAHDIVARFWSTEEAVVAQAHFEALFEKKDYSKAQEISLPAATQNPLWIVELLKLVGAVTSSSEARRLIESGAVTVDGTTVSEFKKEVDCSSGMIIKVGKHRIYKLV